MQITLVSSGDTVSDVLNRFEVNFSLNWTEIEEKFSRWSRLVAKFLAKAYWINELKAMVDFLGSAFKVTGLEAPKRNSKISLALWISQVLMSAREAAEASGAIAIQSVDTSVKTDPTSGLIISFGKTLEYLPEKSVTRRTWKDVHAQKFINAFNQNKLVKAFDKDIRYGGKQIGWCRLSCAPYKEQLCDMPEKDLLAEGGMCDTISEFVQQYFDGNPRLDVWVVRFDFIPDSVLATETDPVTAADQPTDFPAPEIEVLEPEEKPIYTISIVADGGFSEERVNRLPPFLIDRKGNLLKKFWHRSCDAGYSEITSKHLSNIAINSGLVVELMAENLEVSQACIVEDPPTFIIDKGGVYRRDRVRRGLAVSYSQVISEYLSNIAVV